MERRCTSTLLRGAALLAALAATTATALAAHTDSAVSRKDPAWAPNGRKIAFVVERLVPAGGAVGALYLVNADGTGVKRLTPEVQGLSWPTWSPDSRRIAFVSYPRADPVPTIFVIGADGRGLRKVGQGLHPEWSPGGRRIAYNATTLDSDVGDIFVLDPDRSYDVEVADASSRGAFTMPTWSPDGQRLAFTVTDPPDTGGGVVPHLAFISSYGGRIGVLSRAHAFEADWSPDGRRVVFAYSGRQPGVRVLDLLTQRTSFLHSGSHPRWSPDGRRIVFRDGPDPGSRLYVMRSDGSGVRQLVP